MFASDLIDAFVDLLGNFTVIVGVNGLVKSGGFGCAGYQGNKQYESHFKTRSAKVLGIFYFDRSESLIPIKRLNFNALNPARVLRTPLVPGGLHVVFIVFLVLKDCLCG